MANETSDGEAEALALVLHHKTCLVNALVAVAEARKARGAETFGVEESIDLENLTRAGYLRALEKRRKDVEAQRVASRYHRHGGAGK